jgi:hypothetical protein
LEYQTKPKRYYALHDGVTGKSVIQEVGSTSFQTDVETAEWLQHHEPASTAPRARAESVPGAPVKTRKPRGPNKPKPDAIPASVGNGHQTAPTPEPVMAGSAAE